MTLDKKEILNQRKSRGLQFDIPDGSSDVGCAKLTIFTIASRFTENATILDPYKYISQTIRNMESITESKINQNEISDRIGVLDFFLQYLKKPILQNLSGRSPPPIYKRRYKIRLVGIVGTYPFLYGAVSSTYTMPYS